MTRDQHRPRLRVRACLILMLKIFVDLLDAVLLRYEALSLELGDLRAVYH